MLILTSLIYALFVLQDSTSEALSDMKDLGTIMLVGFVLAVVTAVVLTVVRLRIRDKKPAEPQFISINSRDQE